MVCVWCSLKATSSLTFRSEIDSEGKEKQASEREIDCGSTGALAPNSLGFTAYINYPKRKENLVLFITRGYGLKNCII